MAFQNKSTPKAECPLQQQYNVTDLDPIWREMENNNRFDDGTANEFCKHEHNHNDYKVVRCVFHKWNSCLFFWLYSASLKMMCYANCQLKKIAMCKIWHSSKSWKASDLQVIVVRDFEIGFTTLWTLFSKNIFLISRNLIRVLIMRYG